MEATIGEETFAHYAYEEISGYLLVNRSASDPDAKEELITQMFVRTYQNLLDL